MVRRMWGNGLMVMVLAACVLLPGPVQGAEFDVSKFDQEVGLRFAYGKNTHGASVNIYSLLPRWGMFLKARAKNGAPSEPRSWWKASPASPRPKGRSLSNWASPHGEIYLPHLSSVMALYRRGRRDHHRKY